MEKKHKLNKVRERFLPLSPSVEKDLEDEPSINDFSFKYLLGKGTFGKVYLATHKKTKAIYAIKVINKKNSNSEYEMPSFIREIQIMYKVHHPNVVRLYSHFEDDFFCYLLLEYVPKGKLYEQIYLDKSQCLARHKVALVIKELISSVYYLHNMNPPVIHRDIKPENILIDLEGHVKLTDFGCSNYLNGEIRETFCGSVYFMAPEMITEEGHDEHVDIWSIGVLMYELLTGKAPFSGKDLEDLYSNIAEVKNINYPQDMDLEAKGLISKILKKDPSSRPSLKEILQHPFFIKELGNCENALIKPVPVDAKPFVVSKEVPDDLVNKSSEPYYNLSKETKKENDKRGFEELEINLMGKEDQLLIDNNEVQKGNSGPSLGALLSATPKADSVPTLESFLQAKKTLDSIVEKMTEKYTQKFKEKEKANESEEDNIHIKIEEMEKKKLSLSVALKDTMLNEFTLTSALKEKKSTLKSKEDLVAELNNKIKKFHQENQSQVDKKLNQIKLNEMEMKNKEDQRKELEQKIEYLKTVIIKKKEILKLNEEREKIIKKYEAISGITKFQG